MIEIKFFLKSVRYNQLDKRLNMVGHSPQLCYLLLLIIIIIEINLFVLCVFGMNYCFPFVLVSQVFEDCCNLVSFVQHFDQTDG